MNIPKLTLDAVELLGLLVAAGKECRVERDRTRGRAAHELGDLVLDAVEPFDERPSGAVLDEAAGLESGLDLLLDRIGLRRAACLRRLHSASP
jgi:hypothetical protein